jgi:hypothetical protein
MERQIPQRLDTPYQLGRHVNHDERSRLYPFSVSPEAVGRGIGSIMWIRHVPIFDQGNLGSCTGNAAAGWLATDNELRAGLVEFTDKNGLVSVLDEADAIDIYSAATVIDPWDGAYPPDDTGSDGLSVAKVLQSLGYIDVYTHGFSLDDLLLALQTGPVLVGTNWYDHMFYPDDRGVVTIGGNVAGGHEYLCVGIDDPQQELHFANSWGLGWGDGGYFRMSYATMTRLLSEDGDVTVPHALVVTPIVPPEPDPPVVVKTWWERFLEWLRSFADW